MWFKKASARRQAIREDISELEEQQGKVFSKVPGHLVLIALVFFGVASLIQLWPGEPLIYREGERVPVDLRSPVTFSMVDMEHTRRMQEAARVTAPPVLVLEQGVLDQIRSQLSALKQDVQGVRSAAELPAATVTRFPGLNDASIRALQGTDGESYESQVKTFINRGLAQLPLVPEADYAPLVDRRVGEVRMLSSQGDWSVPLSRVMVLTANANASGGAVTEEARSIVRQFATEVFPKALWEPVTNYVMVLKEPTARFDAKMTTAFAEKLAAQIQPAGPMVRANDVIVAAGTTISPEQYRVLQEAEAAFQRNQAMMHPWSMLLSKLGKLLVVLIITVAGAVYVAQLSGTARTPRQAWVVCGLLLAALALAKLAVGLWPVSLYFSGLMPTMLATIMLVIAYNQRFALGVGALHGLLVTMTLGQGMDFYLPILAGVAVFSFSLREIRTLGKLLEVGALLASPTVFAAVWAMGLLAMGGSGGASTGLWSAPADMQWVRIQSLWAATSGVVAAALALFMLRPVERVFGITTAMRLLEFCDATKPLLRRLSQEAPGTFNHSLTVGIMAEAAAQAIGANGLLCRVGAYYHDVGKLSKPQYFIENQTAGGPNRHDKLSPAMSLLIIVGHVKDGIELAREYALPAVVHQFIGQHHGTTLVEYFYHAARKRAERDEDAVQVSDSEFRYPGPKPQTPETAIVMICDGCESAVRAIDEPTAGRIESAVHNLIMKRLMDGQFSDCDLTLRDLGVIEETLVRTLAAIHHGRVAYPAPLQEGESRSA